VCATRATQVYKNNVVFDNGMVTSMSRFGY